MKNIDIACLLFHCALSTDPFPGCSADQQSPLQCSLRSKCHVSVPSKRTCILGPLAGQVLVLTHQVPPPNLNG